MINEPIMDEMVSEIIKKMQAEIDSAHAALDKFGARGASGKDSLRTRIVCLLLAYQVEDYTLPTTEELLQELVAP